MNNGVDEAKDRHNFIGGSGDDLICNKVYGDDVASSVRGEWWRLRDGHQEINGGQDKNHWTRLSGTGQPIGPWTIQPKNPEDFEKNTGRSYKPRCVPTVLPVHPMYPKVPEIPHADAPNNGKDIKLDTYGDSAIYMCKPGYVFNGKRAVESQEGSSFTLIDLDRPENDAMKTDKYYQLQRKFEVVVDVDTTVDPSGKALQLIRAVDFDAIRA